MTDQNNEPRSEKVAQYGVVGATVFDANTGERCRFLTRENALAALDSLESGELQKDQFQWTAASK